MNDCPINADGTFDCQVDYPTSDMFCCQLWMNRRKPVTVEATSGYSEDRLGSIDKKLTEIYNRLKHGNVKKEVPEKDPKLRPKSNGKRTFNYE